MESYGCVTSLGKIKLECKSCNQLINYCTLVDVKAVLQIRIAYLLFPTFMTSFSIILHWEKLSKGSESRNTSCNTLQIRQGTNTRNMKCLLIHQVHKFCIKIKQCNCLIFL